MYIDRLNTKESGEALTPQYNVYANGSVIHDEEVWKHVRTFFAERTYEDLLLGQLPQSHSLSTVAYATASITYGAYAISQR